MFYLSNYYNAIGNGSQLDTFFRFPFNEPDFLGDLSTCAKRVQHKDDFNNVNFLVQCPSRIKNWYRSKNIFVPQWNRIRESDADQRSRVLADCSYRVIADGYQLWDDQKSNGTMVISFHIDQINCKNRIVGGSTFYIIAHYEDSGILVSCSYKYTTNGRYQVLCFNPFDHLISKFSIRHEICMSLSILLEYEHFDAFGELFDFDNYQYIYPPTRYIIVDDKIFCFRVVNTRLLHASGGPKEEDKGSAPAAYYMENSLNIENDAVLFTGYWKRGKSSSISFLGSSWLEKSSALLPADGTVLYSSPKLAQRIDSYSLLFTHIRLGKNSTAESALQKEVIDWSPTVFSTKTTYHFVGASHMRYFFDSIIEFTLSNSSALKGIDRKHGSLKLGQFHFHNMRFADTQADFLTKFCKEASDGGRGAQGQVLVLQSGTWDLIISNLRQLLHQKDLAVKLVQVLRDIMTGAMRCDGLTHLVFLTAPPYPHCFSHNGTVSGCEIYRGARNSGSLTALNAFYVHALLKIPITRKDVKLSIVDVFSTMKPRMILDENYETVCAMHFLCRTSPTSPVYITPGGLASLESLVLALIR